MKKVLLINQDKIPHYRVHVYNYLAKFLEKEGFLLTVISGGIQQGNHHSIEFEFTEISLSVWSLTRFIRRQRIDIIIFWVNFKCLYLFPMYLIAKALGYKDYNLDA